MKENELLTRLPSLFLTDDPSVIMGSGPDDCAHVRLNGKKGGVLSISTDAFVEGIHFLADANPRDVARKCLGASLSDLAASACEPLWAVVSLCLRPGLEPDWAEAFAEELAAAAKQYKVSIVGGDTVSSRKELFISVTVMGSPLPGGPLFRNGARDGDILAVTGELGGSLLGGHLDPVPRLKEIACLMACCADRGDALRPSAAIDVSDGLAIDLSRLCRESGVGAIIEEDRLPISRDAGLMAERFGGTPLDHALGDGEDFELLIAMRPKTWEAFKEFLAGEPGNSLARFTRIGTVTAGPALSIKKSDGELRPLEPKGYEHAW